MRVFRCICDLLVFFENTQCVNCDRRLAYLPDLGVVSALEAGGSWRAAQQDAHPAGYRLCGNYEKHNVCNWAIPADGPDTLCPSCQLTTVIPNLDVPGNREAWAKLEAAKRRLVYSLMRLGLPIPSRVQDKQNGLAFEFRADEPDKPVLTGHANGVITVNIAEADDAERERRRQSLNEPYRTLLGHFRHESGHFYWDRIVKDRAAHSAFRELFGDERADYGEALERHHAQGAPGDWPQRFISAYASAHPWEDWAETWAHFLHMTDALETAADCGLLLRARRPGDPALKTAPRLDAPRTYEQKLDDWFALTYVLNNLNRGLGLQDSYPFVLSTPVLDKLRFIHDVIQLHDWDARPAATPAPAATAPAAPVQPALPAK